MYTNQNYWPGSPGIFNSGSTVAAVFAVASSGYIATIDVSVAFGIRPVVSLSSKAKLSGSGTYNDVYIVS